MLCDVAQVVRAWVSKAQGRMFESSRRHNLVRLVRMPVLGPVRATTLECYSRNALRESCGCSCIGQCSRSVEHD